MATIQHGGQVPNFHCQIATESVTYDCITRKICGKAYRAEAIQRRRELGVNWRRKLASN